MFRPTAPHSPARGQRGAARQRAALALVLFVLVVAAASLRADTPASAQQAPPFDIFEQRDRWYRDFSVAGDTFPLDRSYATAGATLEAGEGAPCATISGSVWIEWYSDRSGMLDVSISGSGLTSVVAIYDFDPAGDFIPSPPGGNLRPLGCGASGVPGDAARASTAVERDHAYMLQVGTVGAGGELRVQAWCACRPPNDDFADSWRDSFSLDAWQPHVTRTFDVSRATLEAGEPRPCGNMGATIWLDVYTGTADKISLSLSSAGADAVLAVYRQDGMAPFNGAALEQCVDATGAGGTERLTIDAEPYYTYYVQAGTAGGAAGTLVLDAECEPSCPPYNDDVANTGYMDVPAYLSDITTGATLEPGEPRPCGNIGATIWYQVVARGGTGITVTVERADDGFDPMLAAYSQEGPESPFGAFDLLDCEAGTQSAPPHIAFDAEAGVSYWIQVGGRDGDNGTLDIAVDCDPQPCPPYADARHYPYYYLSSPDGLPFEDFIDTTNASTEPGEPLRCGDMARTIWLPLYAMSLAPIRIRTEGSTFDAAIAVYEAPGDDASFAEHGRIACADGSAPGTTELRFTPTAVDRPLYIQVGGRGGAGGELHLQVDCDGFCPPLNDSIAGAYYIYPLGHVEWRDLRGATTEPDEPQPCGLSATAWWRFDSQWDADVRLSLQHSDFAAGVAVYAIEAPSPPGGLQHIACGDTMRDLEFHIEPGVAYYVQAGLPGAGVAGNVNLSMQCAGDCPVELFSPPGGLPGGGAGVIGPDTGSGGQAGGRRRP